MNQKDQKIYDEAVRRFHICEGWESTARSRALDDIKFANADSENGWQWPTAVSSLRAAGNRPNLTINKVRQHCLQILNDARQNKPAIKVLATGGEASSESAKVFEDVIRRIEYNSNAENAYLNAMKFQVQGGIGYWRVRNDYLDNESFDQEIFIEPIIDPLMVMMDPNIKQLDGSDARFAFIWSDIPRDRFNMEYPELKDQVSHTTRGPYAGWLSEDTVRICEYYRVKEKKSRIVAYVYEGQTLVTRYKDIPEAIRDELLRAEGTRVRTVFEREVQWFKIAGDHICESTVIPCSTIPVVRVVGEETIINGQLDRKGHVRAMKDPQRMYNYHASASVESVAMQNVIPYLVAIEAIEGYENVWKTANINRPAFLPYRHKDEAGGELPPPQRQSPPELAAAYPQLMQMAQDQIESVSGQRESNMGQSTNDQSGVALTALQQRGDNSTYHYIDNLAVAIRYTGKIIIDMIPRVYDTPRIVKIRAEDGTESTVKINPEQPEAVRQVEDEREAEASAIFNPSVGKYDVMASVGPAYQTRRREAFNALVQILASPTGQSLIPVVGDLLFKVADFPMAMEIAERLRRTIPANILGEGPPPELQAMQQQFEQLQGAFGEAMQALADKSKEHEIDEQQKQIDVYKAITDRLDTLLKNQDKASPEETAGLMAQIIVQSLTKPLPEPMEAEHANPDIGLLT